MRWNAGGIRFVPHDVLSALLAEHILGSGRWLGIRAYRPINTRTRQTFAAELFQPVLSQCRWFQSLQGGGFGFNGPSYGTVSPRHKPLVPYGRLPSSMFPRLRPAASNYGAWRSCWDHIRRRGTRCHEWMPQLGAIADAWIALSRLDERVACSRSGRGGSRQVEAKNNERPSGQSAERSQFPRAPGVSSEPQPPRGSADRR
jgi:hypothetical protein